MTPHDVTELAGRDGWTVSGKVGIYAPDGSGWSARVAAVVDPGRTVPRWTVALVDPAGAAQRTYVASDVVGAARMAERHVDARLAG